MKILLAIDGSTFSDVAVNEVATRPWPAGSVLRIISVVEPPLPTIETWVPPPDYIESLQQAAEDQARSIINKASKQILKAQGDNLRSKAEIVDGNPRQVIADYAEDWQADLIV